MAMRHIWLCNKLQNFGYCTKSVHKNKSYSHTVCLPKTEFPLRIENKHLVERETYIANVAEFEQLYKWQRGHLSEPEFVLHDGPPYANGNLHMGHAVNKILKDSILRYHIIRGNKVHYIPGWDCHGLPIELKALGGATDTKSSVEIRSAGRNFAMKTIEEQKKGFQSWGVVGDWDHHYATSNPNYVKTQLKIFYKLYKKGLIYRDLKPVYWSPSSRTALAEAELEYNESHKSKSVYIRFKMTRVPNRESNGIYALIWTTTPWTLPANQAICYNPKLPYSLVKNPHDNTSYIVASDLVDNISGVLNTKLEILENFEGDLLSKCEYQHPVYKNRTQKFVPASHATSTKGTGLVHTAPAHGPDDFLVALQQKLEIDNLVNEAGCFNASAGEDLEGRFVLSKGTEKVLQMLQNDLLKVHDFTHSYPYDWRTKQPVIIRASQQWFLDTNSIKNRAIELLDDVRIIPKYSGDIYKKNLIDQIQRRPYWCISRQRKWGVPIPVFYQKPNDSVILNEDIIRHLSDLIDIHALDYWWTLPLSDLLPKDVQQSLNLSEITRGEDILDIWFDSGVSWAIALEGTKVADLYLEGVDQFTGWFQSSLITSVALRDKAPYKSIYVHGFVVDGDGLKMSKSLGNVVDPLNVVNGGGQFKKAYGVNTLRWWVVCHANQDSVAHISENLLQTCAEEVQKIRSVLRFTLASLNDCSGVSEISTQYDQLSVIDKYMLHLLCDFYNQAAETASEYQFHKMRTSVLNFLTNPVSALYFTAIKDRLYCSRIDSFERRSAQFILSQVFEIVSQVIAPAVPHLVEELYLHYPLKSGRTYFKSSHGKPSDQWNNVKVKNLMDVFLDVKRDINKRSGAKTSQLVAQISLSPAYIKTIQEITPLRQFEAELEDVFQVSAVQIIEDNSVSKCNFKVVLHVSNQFTCPRCRKIQSERADDLCTRCVVLVDDLNNKGVVLN